MTHFTVVASSDTIAAEALVTTPNLREALRAVDTVALFAPAVSLSLYENGYMRILRVQDGRWRVPVTDALRRTA